MTVATSVGASMLAGRGALDMANGEMEAGVNGVAAGLAIEQISAFSGVEPSSFSSASVNGAVTAALSGVRQMFRGISRRKLPQAVLGATRAIMGTAAANLLSSLPPHVRQASECVALGIVGSAQLTRAGVRSIKQGRYGAGGVKIAAAVGTATLAGVAAYHHLGFSFAPVMAPQTPIGDGYTLAPDGNTYYVSSNGSMGIQLAYVGKGIPYIPYSALQEEL